MRSRLSIRVYAFFLAVVPLADAPVTSAATYALELVADRSYQPDFTPIPGRPDLTTLNGIPRIYEIEFHASVSNLQPGEQGLGNIKFDISLSPSLTEAGAGGWDPNTAQTDSNGPASGGIVPLFAVNEDGGPSATDLLNITASIAGGISNPHSADGRVKIGQPSGPSLLGTLFVRWDAQSSFALTVSDVQVSTYTTAGTFLNPVSAPGAFLIPFPEPASYIMATIALIGLAAARRRRTGSI